MRYTVITPTLLRPTLGRLCDSLDAQTCIDWQHIVIVDRKRAIRIPAGMADARREFVFCDRPRLASVWAHVDRLKHDAWALAEGDYVIYVDDDNYLADELVLESLLAVTEPVALFPICYRGTFAPPLPVAVGRSDGNALMVERSVGRWPITSRRRESDGEFVVQLTTDHPYEVLSGRALVVYEREGYGRL